MQAGFVCHSPTCQLHCLLQSTTNTNHLTGCLQSEILVTRVPLLQTHHSGLGNDCCTELLTQPSMLCCRCDLYFLPVQVNIANENDLHILLRSEKAVIEQTSFSGSQVGDHSAIPFGVMLHWKGADLAKYTNPHAFYVDHFWATGCCAFPCAM